MSSFSLLIGLGASVALLRLVFATPDENRIIRLLQGLMLQAVALLGARLAFILAHVTYFSTRKNEILNFNAGGLWWPGAVIGALLVIVTIGILQNGKLKEMLDRFSVFLLPLGVSFWLASWWAGVAYGARLGASVWWWMPMLDNTGVIALRVPLQPVAACTLLLILCAIEWRWRKPVPKGRRMGVLMVVLSVHTLLFSLLRADPVQAFLGIRMDVWASILFAITAVVLLGFTFEVKSKKTQIQEEITA